jgi:hypothetical protein
MVNKGKTAKYLFMFTLLSIFLIGSVSALNNCGKYHQTTHTYKHLGRTYAVYDDSYADSYNFESNSRVENPQRISYLNKHDNTYYSYYRKPTKTIVNYRQRATQETRKDFVGSYVKDYSVTITNKERTGRYFTVQFNFRDKNGYEFSQSITQYVKDGERKKFDYRDIQFERHEITNWDYEIMPEKD